MKIVTLVLTAVLGALPLVAQDPPARTAPGAEQLRWEWREFAVADIHDLRFGAYEGSITFSIGGETYIYSPAFKDDARSSPAANVSACAAVLGELRNASKLKMQVAIGPKDKGHHGLSNLILLFDPAK